jgi:hypothetical protein
MAVNDNQKVRLIRLSISKSPVGVIYIIYDIKLEINL